MSLDDRTFYGQYVEQKQAKGKNGGMANNFSKDVWKRGREPNSEFELIEAQAARSGKI